MLPGTQKHHWDARRMHHADQRADHISHGITLGYHKAIQLPPRTKARVEVARLCNAICANQRLAHHENLIWIR